MLVIRGHVYRDKSWKSDKVPPQDHIPFGDVPGLMVAALARCAAVDGDPRYCWSHLYNKCRVLDLSTVQPNIPATHR